MPEQIIIRGSTYSTYDTNARGPFASTYESRNNIKRFNEAKRDLYGGANHIGDDPFFNFGFRQPYVWTSLNDSDFKKYIKRYDSREMPIGSTIQDTERIGKMLVSGKGILFLAKQALLQAQNPFNETTIYNPLSVPQAIVRKGTFGFLPMPLRHIDQGNLFNTFGFGGGGAKQPPRGTIAERNSEALPNNNRSDGAGMLRARTANSGLLRFDSKWGTSFGKRPSFFDSLLSKFAPPLATLPPQIGKYRSDENSYNIMIKDISKSKNSSVLHAGYSNSKYSDSTIFKQPFYSKDKNSGVFYNISKQRIEPRYKTWQTEKHDTNGTGSKNNSSIDVEYEKIFVQNFIDPKLREPFRKYEEIPSENTSEQKYGRKVFVGSDDDNSISRLKNLHEITINSIGNGSGLINPTKQKTNISFDDKKVKNLNEQLKLTLGEDKFFKINNYATGKKTQSGTGKPSGKDPEYGYNKRGKLRLGKQVGKLEDIGLAAPNGNYKDRYAKDKIGSVSVEERSNTNERKDLINFFFDDLINQKIIRFRACLSGISQSNSADYEKFKYIGRSDNLYLYKGFSRSLNFSFKIYPNNEKELKNNWDKLNYIIGACQPADYINDFYIVPPFFSLTLGKIFTDQPIIINNINTSMEDDGGWDIDNELPMIISVSVDCDILQTKRPVIGNGQFGYNNNLTVISNNVINNAVNSNKLSNALT